MAHCPTCLGWGKLRPPPGKLFGRDGFTTDCPECSGTGYVFLHPCAACRGDGLTEVEEERTVSVPEDAGRGETIVVRGAGHTGPRGGARGRLRVKIEQKSEGTPGRD